MLVWRTILGGVGKVLASMASGFHQRRLCNSSLQRGVRYGGSTRGDDPLSPEKLNAPI
jgi:hypothetical protein